MGEETSSLRTEEMTDLLNYGFNMYQMDTYITTDEVIDIIDDDKALNKINVVVLNDVSIVNKKGHNMGEITYDLSLNKIKLPIKKGDIIGSLSIKENGIEISNSYVTVLSNVDKASIFHIFYRTLRSMLGVY